MTNDNWTTKESGVEFLAVYWGNGFGIVLVNDEYDGIKAYAKAVNTGNEELDIKDIMDYGNTFPLESAKVLFPNFI